MPGYNIKTLQKFKHVQPTKPHDAPYPIVSQKIGSAAQKPIHEDHTLSLDKDKVNASNKLSEISFTMHTPLIGPSKWHSWHLQMTKQKQQNRQWPIFISCYMAYHTGATIWYHAVDMILNIHSNASHLLDENAKSRALGHFY